MTTEEIGRKRAEELGLKCHAVNHSINLAYACADIHRLLGEAVEMYGWQNNGVGAIKWSDSSYAEVDSHAALLIGTRPVKQPSREEEMASLLCEMLSFMDASLVSFAGLDRFKNRAKLLLERKDK